MLTCRAGATPATASSDCDFATGQLDPDVAGGALVELNRFPYMVNRAEIDVSFGTSVGGDPSRDDFDAGARLEALDELATLGVTWCGVGVPGDSLHALETLERFGELVIRPGGA